MINAPKLLKTNQRNVKFSLSSSLLLHIALPESISDKLAKFSPQSVPPNVVKSDVVFDQDRLTCCFLLHLSLSSLGIIGGAQICSMCLSSKSNRMCFHLILPLLRSFVFLHNFDLQLRYGHYVITMPMSCGHHHLYSYLADNKIKLFKLQTKALKLWFYYLG